MTASGHAEPGPALLTDVRRATVELAGSLVHAPRRAVSETPDRDFPAHFAGRPAHREADELGGTDPRAGCAPSGARRT
ncbi:hypothetical protein AB0420_20930 [Streptomyces caelestis]|uniref:hypothetical protein n=1 Tax=Streptomyces caelestis TaxID=36816 RepID=UPI003451092D